MTLKRLYCAAIQIVAAVSMIFTTGCSTPKDITYFQDINADEVFQVNAAREIKIKPGDKLSIIVNAKDAAVSSLFNLPITSKRLGDGDRGTSAREVRSYISNNGNDGISYYTVTPKGDIDFPLLGNLHVAGMSRYELAAFIKGEIEGRELAKNPVVTVEYLNTGFSVMGEVAHPGRYDINTDRLTLLQAIALAGDLSIQGKRENVKVVRQEADGLHTYVVDLTNMNKLTQSPAYYVQQDDLIYIEPSEMRKRSTTVNGNTALSASFWVSVASLLTSVAVLIFK